MANPQTENGFTRIANEILDHLTLPGISGCEYRIALFVMRKTYGFGKKKDVISLTQFQKGTLTSRRLVVSAIKSLVSKRVLLKEKSVYSFNKNWEEWVVSKREPSVQKGTSASSQKGSKGSSQKGTHKRKIKERIKEIDTPETSSGGLVSQVIKLFEEVNPATKSYYNRPNQREACQKLVDEYGFEEVSKVVAFLPRSNKIPFVPTITTPLQLWEKYQSLKDGLQRKKAELSTKGRGLEI